MSPASALLHIEWWGWLPIIATFAALCWIVYGDAKNRLKVYPDEGESETVGKKERERESS